MSLEDDEQVSSVFPGRQGAQVTVMLKDGRRSWRRLDDLEPLDASGVRMRTGAALASLLGEARTAAVELAIDSITGGEDAGQVSRLLGTP